MPERHSARSNSVLIKRYAGRRLYNTVSSTYVTLEDLADMILAGGRFIVPDAETGVDITRDVLDRLH
jgi:polyhydroxyalkanoate synthesis repressor PhaR